MKTSAKAPSRPARTFLPATLKPIKILHFKGEGAKYIGESEPAWPSLDVQKAWTREQYETHLSNALNWYAQTQEDKEIISLGLAALNLSGHFPELVIAIKNSTLTFSITVAKVLRMAHCGLVLRFHERRFVVKYLKECLENQKQIEEKESRTSSKPNIQDHLRARIRKVCGEVDYAFDQFVGADYSVGKKANTVASILKDPDTTIPANRSKDLIEYCQKYLSEYKVALTGKDKQITESYGFLGKRKLKSAIEWWEQAISDVSLFSNQKQSIHKTRQRKPKPPSKIVSKLKFLREYKELKLTSIDATQVLKCSELWVYNTKLRKLGHYVALNGMAFEVKSTRLTNIDPTKSLQKTLRKPAEQLKEFSNYGKPGAVKWFSGIRATATPLREAINGDSILLRGVK
jgi:hypothetical protein